MNEKSRVPNNIFFGYGVDVVELVRCKDCEYRRHSSQGWYCGYEYDRSDPYEMTRRADDENYYCADAVRKEGKENADAV